MTLITFTTLALAATTAFSGVANAHMKLQSPVPFGKDNLDTSPLNDAKPGSSGSNYPCKQRAGVYDISERTKMAVGETQKLVFSGSSSHGGGTCMLALSTDAEPNANTEWKLFHGIEGGCPILNDASAGGSSPYDYKIPEISAGNYTLAWFWYNRIGNRELYMNCAPIEVTGSGSNEAFNSLPNAYIINLPTSECSTVEMTDQEIPYQGNAVVTNGGATKLGKATGPSCAASAAAQTKGVSGGSGSAPASGAASSPTPTASSTPAGYGGSSPSSMILAAVSSSLAATNGGYGNGSPSFITMRTAGPAASSPAHSSASSTMTPSSGYSGSWTGSSASGSYGSGSSSVGSSDGRLTCSSDGTQFGVDVYSKTVWRPVAQGTKCHNGHIVKRSASRHAHTRRNLQNAGHV